MQSIGQGPKEILHHRKQFLTVGGVSLALATSKKNPNGGEFLKVALGPLPKEAKKGTAAYPLAWRSGMLPRR